MFHLGVVGVVIDVLEGFMKMNLRQQLVTTKVKLKKDGEHYTYRILTLVSKIKTETAAARQRKSVQIRNQRRNDTRHFYTCHRKRSDGIVGKRSLDGLSGGRC